MGEPEWLLEAKRAWSEPAASTVRTALIPIWRRPWMALGSETFAGDMLRHLGVANVLADDPERYPRLSIAELAAVRGKVDLIVLPDEPYVFGPEDGPEAFVDSDVDVCCVSGRHLTWYGPSLVEAASVLRTQLSL